MPKPTKTDVAKAVTGFVIGACTTTVVRALIRQNVALDKTADKVALAVGTYVLGAIAADATKEWTDAKIDELIEQYQKTVKGKPEVV